VLRRLAFVLAIGTSVACGQVQLPLPGATQAPPQLPLLLFADDPEFAKVLAWSRACARHGVYLHPVHNWFLSTAHDEATIDEALARTDEAFREVRDAHGAG